MVAGRMEIRKFAFQRLIKKVLKVTTRVTEVTTQKEKQEY